MTESVQDVFDTLLEAHRKIVQQEYGDGDYMFGTSQLDNYIDGWKDRFAKSVTVEKVSKSKPLTEKQKNCPYCHEGKDWIADNDVIMHYGTDSNGLPILDINDHGHWITTDAICCQWCGRKLDGDD